MPALDNPALFRQFVDSLPFGAYIADPGKRVLYWNRRAEEISGFLAQDVVGRSCADSILEHCSPGGAGVCASAICPLARVIRDCEPTESRLFMRHREGHRIPVHVRALPLKDEHGKLAAIAEVFQEETVGPDGLCWITENIDRFDRAMGLPSATASRAQLQLSLSLTHIPTAAFVIGIKDLHDMAINRGHELANLALRVLAQTISRLLNMPHYLGCWPNDRLLGVVPNCSQELMLVLTRSLEDTGSSCHVTWWGERVPYHVEVRAAMLAPDETFECLLRKLDPELPGAG